MRTRPPTRSATTTRSGTPSPSPSCTRSARTPGGRPSAQARKENSEHLAEEEDEALPDFRRHASTELRAELGQRWLTFYGEHKNGRDLPFRDKDPQGYVADHR